MELLKKLTRIAKKGYSKNSSVVLVFIFLLVSCLVVLFALTLKLPGMSLGRARVFCSTSKLCAISEEENFGEFGEMMVGMLPGDLPFTIFLPSEKAFDRDLKLQAIESLADDKANDTHAVLSRVLGFSAVPWHLTSVMVPVGEEIFFDSISGFKLQATRIAGKSLVVNDVGSEQVDRRRGEIVVHIMNGVIMDAEFEQSVRPEDEEVA